MTNKLLLAAIALGLWANALGSWVRPARADASSIDVSGIVSAIGDVSRQLNNIDFTLAGKTCGGTRP